METCVPRKHLTHEQALAVYHFLLEKTIDGQLAYGAVQQAMEKFNISRSTVQRLRNRAASSDEPVGVSAALKSRMKGTVGRKPIADGVTKARLSSTPLRFRGAMRSTAIVTCISKTTLIKALKSGGNGYKLPHISKNAARRAGREITQVFCGQETLKKAREFIGGK